LNALRWHAIRQEAQEGLIQVQTGSIEISRPDCINQLLC
jgi:hypothetical protein